MTTAGKFVWFELVTTDRAKSEAFYGEVLGWKTAAMPMGDHSYTLINNGATAVGGLVAAQGKEPSHWISYVAVPDVDQALAKVKAAGGKTTGPAIDVPTVGRMAEIADPQGAALYVFTPSGAEQPPQQVAGAFFWNELWTSDPAAALRFYEGVVGYGHTDKDMGPRGTYHVLTQGDRQLAGIMTAPAGVPTMWLPYVAVDDCDAAATRATRNGATVVNPPADIPGIGRFAIVKDPTGAVLALIRPQMS